MPEAAKYRNQPYNTGVYYARRQRTDGRRGSQYYLTQADYNNGVSAMTGSRAAQRRRINRSVGANARVV